MKKLLIFLFAVALILPIASCFGKKGHTPPVKGPEPSPPPIVLKEGCMEAVCSRNKNEPICLRAFDYKGDPILDGGGKLGTPSVYWYGKMGKLIWERGEKTAGITTFSWQEAAENGFYWDKKPATFDGKLNARGEFFGTWYVTLCKSVK